MAIALLTDFGLAKAADTASKYTRTGQALGTPAYMSPEQARGEGALTPASDVWSLGCVLFELLAGRRVNEGATPAEALAASLSSAPPSLRRLRPDLPRALDRVVRGALARSPADRYGDGRALRADLDRLLRAERPVGSPVHRRRAVRAAAACGLAACALAGAWVWLGRAPSPPVPESAVGVDEVAAQAARAWAARFEDLPAARAGLESALAAAPARQDWRVQAGLLAWATDDLPGARRHWAAVPGAAAEATRARFLRGLAAHLSYLLQRRRELLAESREAWEAAGAGEGPEAEWARAALPLTADPPAAVAGLAPADASWEASLLRAVSESAIRAHGGSWQPEVARRGYSAALDTGLPFAWGHAARGEARKAMGDLPGAREDYDAAVRLAPDAAPIRVNRGNVRWQLGDVEGAHEDFAAAVRVAPDYALGHANLGLVRFEARALVEARAHLDRALALDPDPPSAWIGRADVRHAAGDDDGALSDLDEALMREPNHPAALRSRSQLRFARRDASGAEADFAALLALDPASPAYLTGRGACRVLLEDLAGARADFDAALAAAPDHINARYNRAEVRARCGDVAGGIEDLTGVLARDPSNVHARGNRAIMRATAGDTAAALEDFEVVLRARPDDPLVRANLGATRLGAGDPAGAVADLERALALAPPGWPHRAKFEALLRQARNDAR